jgi:hypothetical protein
MLTISSQYIYSIFYHIFWILRHIIAMKYSNRAIFHKQKIKTPDFISKSGVLWWPQGESNSCFFKPFLKVIFMYYIMKNIIFRSGIYCKLLSHTRIKAGNQRELYFWHKIIHNDNLDKELHKLRTI